jgi:hypothetical protein
MIQITQDEANAINIISIKAQSLQAELTAVHQARQATISLIENKYDAVFDPQTGQFNSKKNEKDKKDEPV